MLRFVFLLTLAACLIGCTTSRQSTQTPLASSFEAIGKPNVFGPEQLAGISPGRFCLVHSTNPGTLHEGTILSTTADEVVLSDAAVLGPRTMGLFGNLSFDWSHRLSHGFDVTFPERVAIPRAAITSIDVFDAEESERLCASFAEWRAKRKRIHAELLTDQEFPSSG